MVRTQKGFKGTLCMIFFSYDLLAMYIYPFIFYTCVSRFRVTGGRSLYDLSSAERRGHILDTSPVHQWATKRQMRQPSTLMLITHLGPILGHQLP